MWQSYLLIYVSASVYETWSLTGGQKCRVSVEKLPGPQFGVRPGWEVLVSNCIYAKKCKGNSVFAAGHVGGVKQQQKIFA